MYSLYIDTSTKYLCLGIAKDYSIIYKYQEEAIKKQSELAIPCLKNALEECSLNLSEIGEVVVTIGPGSFTGIRIGMCIAKVIATINKIPLKALSSLKSYSGNGKKIVILDAKANRVYLGIYNDYITIKDECVMEIEEFKKKLEEYKEYEVVLDSYLIGRDNLQLNVIENMNYLAKITKPIDNVEGLIPIYLKDR